jgi:hypothetical protein
LPIAVPHFNLAVGAIAIVWSGQFHTAKVNLGGLMNILKVIAGLLMLVGSAEAQELRAYPDSTLTPGATDPSLTPEYICSHSASERRSVTTAQKNI